jgi:sec-independent protein translocase protein TatC
MTPSNPPDDPIEVTAVPVPDAVPETAITAPQATLAESMPASVTVPDEEPGGAMTFFEHLTELRKRLINSIAALAIGAFIGVSLSKYLIDYVTRPIVKALKAAGQTGHLYYTHPAGYLNLYITLGVYLGIVLAAPYVLYQIWLFVAPALYKHERSAISGFVASTFFLFVGGIAFGYTVALPYMLKFLVSFQGPASNIEPMITTGEYFDLVLMVLLGFGIVFELPILIFFLSLFGIVTPKFLWSNFRYAILVISIVAAVITPSPDATTMLIFMAPMVALYVISIGVSALVVNRRNKRLAAEEAAAA